MDDRKRIEPSITPIAAAKAGAVLVSVVGFWAGLGLWVVAHFHYQDGWGWQALLVVVASPLPRR